MGTTFTLAAVSLLFVGSGCTGSPTAPPNPFPDMVVAASPDLGDPQALCSSFDLDAGIANCNGACSLSGRACATCGQTEHVPCREFAGRLCVNSCSDCGSSPDCGLCEYRMGACQKNTDCCTRAFEPRVACVNGVCEVLGCIATEGAKCPKTIPQNNLCCNGLVCDPVTLTCKK